MDINQEILECARYGEHEELAMYIAQGADVNFTDDSGNTALHKACANGEIECIKVLLAEGAKRMVNKSGNYPEHWAAQNGKTKALELLFEKFTTEMDVLAKNSFGRSVVTEAFESKETDAIALCLNHSSASEERIIPGNNKSKTNEDGDTVIECSDPDDIHDIEVKGDATTNSSSDAKGDKSSEEENAVFHDFIFNNFQKDADSDCNSKAISMRIKELPIDHADTPFGSDTNPEDDTTGLAIWPASILLSQWVCDELCNRNITASSNVHVVDNYTVLELGAGVGLPGITAAECLSRVEGLNNVNVYVTDIHSKSIENSKVNALLNGYEEMSKGGNELTSYIKNNVNLHIQNMSWNDQKTYPKDEKGQNKQVDLLLGSDLVYELRILEYLVPTIVDILKPGGKFLYIAPEEGNRQGMQEFIAVMQSHTTIRTINNEIMNMDLLSISEKTTAYGIVLKSVRDCPDEYYANPFPDSSAYDRGDQLVLHFYDLAAKKKHILYEFEKVLINIEKE